MYELAKQSREKMKAKARALASERDQKVDSSDWSPAAPLRAEIKTGARPIMKPSSKGIGESNAARDTKAAIGRDMKRGAFKSGGAVKDAGIKDKKALGAIDPSPKRGPAGHYKRGGKAEGGSLLKRLTGAKSEAEKQSESMRDVGKDQTQRYSQEDKGALNRALTGNDALPEAGEAAERSGKYQNYKRGGNAKASKRLGKAHGGALDLGGKKPKSNKHAKTDIKINILAAGHRPAMPGMPAAGATPPAVGLPMPPVAAPPAAPMGAPPMPMGPGVPARKAGGRITKVASSYKDMEAGAASGEGRLQKTDIAKKHHDAPARKAGGRITKVAKSYKDMEAGAGSGEGRLQKEDIAKAKKARRA